MTGQRATSRLSRPKELALLASSSRPLVSIRLRKQPRLAACWHVYFLAQQWLSWALR